jgi:hypothetical protein
VLAEPFLLACAARQLIHPKAGAWCAGRNPARPAMFTKDFDHYVCDGDSISCDVDGFHVVARLEYDDDTTPPDERQDGFWPSLDPEDAGYIGPRSKRTLERHKARAQHVLDTWKRDEWHYYGVVVNVFKNGVQLTEDYHHATWGIEGNWPAHNKRLNPNEYFRHVANDYLPEALAAAKRKIATLCEA